MNKKSLFIIISSFIVMLMLSGVIFIGITRVGGQSINEPVMAKEKDTDDTVMKDNDDTYSSPTPVVDNTSEDDTSDQVSKEPFVPATKLDLDPSSITVFVNKEYALPKDYKPTKLITPNVAFNLTYFDERTLMRPEAAKALEKLFNAAKEQGIVLYGVSAYRSYDRQHTIFTDNIAKRGKRYTLRYSAVPGTSEHQTGLAIDVSAKSQNFQLDDDFASSPEGEWVAENAYKYGYIIRYTKGNEDITGYAFEPWHIRYVGVDLANYLYTNELTLEEYYKYTPNPKFNFEAKYAAIINYVAPVVTKAPVLPSVSPSISPTVAPTLPAEVTEIPDPEDETIPSVTDTPEPSGDGTNTTDPGDQQGSENGTPDDNSGAASPTPPATPMPTQVPTPDVASTQALESDVMQ